MNRILKQRFNQISRQRNYLIASHPAPLSHPVPETAGKPAPARAGAVPGPVQADFRRG